MDVRRHLTRPRLAVGVALLTICVWSLANLRREGDTLALAQGAAEARRCLEDGVFERCPGVVHFAFFQYVPAWFAGIFTSDVALVAAFLAVLSVVSFAILAGLGWWALNRRAAVDAGDLYVLVLVCGPLLWYVASSFGEMLAAALILGFVVAVLLEAQPWVIAVCLIAAALTKEPALPFVLALGVLAVVIRTPFGARVRVRRSELAAVAVGSVVALTVTGGFNVFRYGEVWNQQNLDPALRTPSLAIRADFAAGLVASPSGGLLVFWPLFAGVLVAVAWSWWRGRRAGRRGLRTLAPLGIPVVVIVLVIGFSGWFSPFGWIAWGPRLLLPWLPALLLLSLAFLRDECRRLGTACRSSALVGLGLSVVSTLCVLAHAGAVGGHPDALSNFFFNDDARCVGPPSVEDAPDRYYACVRHLIWEEHPLILSALDGLPTASGMLLAISGAVVAFGSVAALGRRSVVG